MIAGQHDAREIVLFASVATGTIHQVVLPAAVHSVNSVSFVDAQRGWILANVVGAMGSESFDLYQTTNGGATWMRVAGAGLRETALGQPPFGGDKSGISFRDASVGWLTGGYNTLGAYFFSRTADGERTWQGQSLPLPPSYQRDRSQLWTDPPRLFGQRDGVFPMTMLAIPPTLILYVTHDRGAIWHPTIPIRGSAANDRFAWFFLDAQHGWATNGGPLWMTQDGGMHWMVIQSNVDLSDVRHLDFVNMEQGWAVLSGAGCHDGQVLETVDGGPGATTVDIAPAS